MAVFNFTVRATDSEGSFADRSFNINVRNSKIERYMTVTTANAYTSADAASWTVRTGMGGFSCAYGNGFWIILTSTGFRKSFDGVNYNSILLADTVWIDGAGNNITSNRTTSFTAMNPKIRFMNGKFVLPNWSAQSVASSTMGQRNPGIWISDDCVTWSFKPALTGWNGHTSSNDFVQWIVSEDNGTILLNCPFNNSNGNYLGWMTSDNGTTWTALRQVGNSSTTTTSDFVTRFNGLYMLMQMTYSASSNGPYLYSTDGQNWVAGNTLQGNSGNNLTQFVPYQFAYANGKIYQSTVRVGGNSSPGSINTSLDGLNWTNVNIQTFSNLSAVTGVDDSRLYNNKPVLTYKNGVYLLAHPQAVNTSGGSGLGVQTAGLRLSTDGVNWTIVNNYAAANATTPFLDVAVM